MFHSIFLSTLKTWKMNQAIIKKVLSFKRYRYLQKCLRSRSKFRYSLFVKEKHYGLIHCSRRIQYYNDNDDNNNNTTIFARQKEIKTYCDEQKKNFSNESKRCRRRSSPCQCILRFLMVYWCGNIAFRREKEFFYSFLDLRAQLILCFSCNLVNFLSCFTPKELPYLTNEEK